MLSAIHRSKKRQLPVMVSEPVWQEGPSGLRRPDDRKARILVELVFPVQVQCSIALECLRFRASQNLQHSIRLYVLNGSWVSGFWLKPIDCRVAGVKTVVELGSSSLLVALTLAERKDGLNQNPRPPIDCLSPMSPNHSDKQYYTPSKDTAERISYTVLWRKRSLGILSHKGNRWV